MPSAVERAVLDATEGRASGDGRSEPRPDASERAAARFARFEARHPVLAARVALARTVLVWLAIPVVVIAWIVVPGGGEAIAVLVGLLWLLLQGYALGRSKSLSWTGYARTFTWAALLAPAIAGLEVLIGSLLGWHAGDEAPTVGLAGPMEETLKLLPLAAVFLFARNRWRRLGTADFALLGLAAGAGFHFAEDTIRRVVAAAQPQPAGGSLLQLLLGLHGTNGVATDYGVFQLFPGGETLGHLSLGGLVDVTVFPGHAVLTALVAVGVGLALRGRRRAGRKVWLLPLLLWVAVVVNHMVANYATYGGRTPGQPWVALPGVMSTLIHIWYAVGGAYLLLLVLFVVAVVLDYRTIVQFEPQLPGLPGDSPAHRLRRYTERRALAMRASLPADAASSIKRAVGGLASAIDSTGRAVERAAHELALLVACAGTQAQLWFTAMWWTRERRELAYRLWRAAGGPRRRRPPEPELRRQGAAVRAALKQVAGPAVAAVLGIGALVVLSGTVHSAAPGDSAFIAGLLSAFGNWWSHLSTVEQILAVLGLGGLLGLGGMEFLPALGLAAGASTFADSSSLLGSFIRDPRRTTQELLRNLTPGQVAALGAGFLLQRLLPAAGGHLLGSSVREGISDAAAGAEGEAGTGLVAGSVPPGDDAPRPSDVPPGARGDAGLTQGEQVGIVRQARQGTGNYGLGSAT